MSTHEELAAQTAAFALGTLDPDEATIYQLHMIRCEACRQALREYREATGLVGLGVAQVEPPASLKESVMREVRGPISVPPGRSLAVRRRLAAVALLVLMLAGWGWGVIQQQRVDQLAPAAEQVAGLRTEREVLTRLIQAGNAQTRTMLGDESAAAATGEIVMAPGETVALLRVSGMPTLAPGQVYQVWLIRDGTRTSSGLFRVDASGRGEIVLDAPEAMGNYQALGVTVEPEGGSAGPTSPRVVGASLYGASP